MNKTKKPAKKSLKTKKVKAIKKTKPVKVKAVKAAKPVKVKASSTSTTIKSKIMTCIVTGIERRVSKTGIVKGIKKFGDLDTFISHYVGNEAKRLLKQRVSPEEVQKQLRPSHLKPFEINHQVLARLKLLKKPRNKKMTEQEATSVVKSWKPAERRFYSTLQEYVIDNTKNGSCINPRLYLDYDRECDECKYAEWCLSTAKQFSKRYKK